MDKLKDCTPAKLNMTVRFFGHDIKSLTIIHGRKDELCLVDKSYNGMLVYQCAYTRDSIKALTAKTKYDDAKAKRLQVSTSDPATLAETHDCKMVARAGAAKGEAAGTAAGAMAPAVRKGLSVTMRDQFSKARNASGELLDDKTLHALLADADLNPIMACGVQAQARHAPIASLATAFKVDASGSPSAVKFAANTLDAAMLTCVTKAIENWTLHVPASGVPLRVHLMINIQEI